MGSINYFVIRSSLWIGLFVFLNVISAQTQENKRVHLGDSITLECNASPKDDVTWDTPTEKRYEINITLANATKEDMGVYVCYIQNTTGVFVATTINLEVEYPATIFEVGVLKKEKTPDDDKTMVAVVDGYPFPYTSLTNQNTKKIWFNLTGTGNITFQMKNVTCGDSGSYEIRSSNSLGVDTYYVTLLVEEPPVFDPDESSNTKQIPRIGDSINLLVKIGGCPKPSCIWSHGDEMIPHKDSGFITSANISVSNSDAFGAYTIEISNSKGQKQVTYNIIPEGPPDPVNITGVTKVTHNSVVLIFVPGFDYDKKQSFTVQTNGSDSYVLAENITDNSNGKGRSDEKQEYVLDVLEANTEYTLEIIALNVDGRSHASNKVTFTTMKTPKNLSTVYGIAGALSAIFVLSILVAGWRFCRKQESSIFEHPHLSSYGSMGTNDYVAGRLADSVSGRKN